MDGERFDAIVRGWATAGASRRRALRGLAGGIAAVLTLQGGEPAAAGKRCPAGGRCPGNQFCIGGRCQRCPAGTSYCPGPPNAGACCDEAAGEICCSGLCCRGNETCCGSSICQDLDTTGTSCGSCFYMCGHWEVCVGGQCLCTNPTNPSGLTHGAACTAHEQCCSGNCEVARGVCSRCGDRGRVECGDWSSCFAHAGDACACCYPDTCDPDTCRPV